MASVFTCTACAVNFSSSDAHKAHYKLDWHRYNLRRKVAALGPVDQGDFDRRLAAAMGPSAPKAEFHARCKECRKSFRSEGLYNQHLQSKKHREAVKAAGAGATATSSPSAPAASSLAVPAVANAMTMADAVDSGGGETVAAAAPSTAAAAAAAPETASARVAGEEKSKAPAPVEEEEKSMEVDSDDGEAKEGEGEAEGDDFPPPRMGRTVCVFCNVEAASFEENCAHMLRQHGFFIPDMEYLTDPEGLVGYVEEKVKLGNICLYCNGKGKTFHTCRALQQHMMDRSHCKLLYDEDEDMHEYEAFYDFTSSYSDAEKLDLVQGAAGASGAPPAAAGEAEEAADDLEISRTLGMTNLGELVLLDGKTVGNRKWNRYYKQRLRTADEREVVVAHRRATRLRLGAMYDEELQKGTSTGGVVSLQHGERRAYGGLPGVSRPKDVKMLRAHQRGQARQRLKTELRQNKLNKTFDRVSDM